MHRTRNAAYGQPYRGFESLPLRQTALTCKVFANSVGVVPDSCAGSCREFWLRRPASHLPDDLRLRDRTDPAHSGGPTLRSHGGAALQNADGGGSSTVLD